MLDTLNPVPKFHGIRRLGADATPVAGTFAAGGYLQDSDVPTSARRCRGVKVVMIARVISMGRSLPAVSRRQSAPRVRIDTAEKTCGLYTCSCVSIPNGQATPYVPSRVAETRMGSLKPESRELVRQLPPPPRATINVIPIAHLRNPTFCETGGI